MLRLTLRTLLAYLDDTLSPAEARDIGHQVTQEQSLNELISRIKSVVRRRRLAADSPDPDRAKLDPNEVAEYLDSMLGSARVVELEKRLLENDQDLAEVASVHQILSLVLGKPAEIGPGAKQRMYRLVTARTRAHTKMDPIGPKRSEGAARSAEARGFDPTPLTMTDTPTSANRVGVFAIVLALLMSLGVMVYVTLNKSREPSTTAVATNDSRNDSTNTQAGRDVDETIADPAAAPSDEASPRQTSPTEPKETAESEKSPDAEALAPLTPIVEPAAPMPTPEELRESGPALDVEAETPTPLPVPPSPEPAPEPAKPAPMEEVAPTPAAPPAVAPVDISIPVATYESPTGIVLRRNEKGWLRIQTNDKLFPLDRIAVPWPERGVFRFRDGLTVVLSNQARVDIESDPDVSAALHLLEGQMVVTTEAKPAILILALGPQKVRIDLSETTTMACEATITAAPSAGDPSRSPVNELELFVGNGQIQIDDGIRKVALVEKQRVVLGGSRGDDEGYQIEPSELPEWVNAEQNSEEKRLVKQLSDAVSYHAEPASGYREVFRKNEEELHQAAIWGLTSLGEVTYALDGLESKYTDVRRTTMEALRGLARQGGESLAAVKTAAHLAYRNDLADELVSFILGFEGADRTNVATYRRLVAGLENPEIKLRQAAIYNLVELRGTDYGFDAHDSVNKNQNQRAIDQWKGWLENQKGESISDDKGLLVPGRD